MKVYFTASIVGKKLFLKNYLNIIDYLKKSGHTIISDHIIKSTENIVDMQSKKERVAFHRRLKKWIIGTDCVVVEASFPSISVGFEISLALNFGKPVLLLYTKEAPSLLKEYSSDNLLCERYTDENLKGLIDDFLNYAQGRSDCRFTFFIDQKIAKYLDRVSRLEKQPKSVYIRSLIRQDMTKKDR